MTKPWSEITHKLKPCPFCGGKPVYLHKVESDAHPGNYWGESITCPACKIYFCEPNPQIRWNARATDKTLEQIQQNDL